MAFRRGGRLRHLIPLLALGCGGTEPSTEIADYTLRLVPVVPSNQAPFDGLSTLELVIEPAVGDAQRYEVSTSASGATAELSDLPALEDATLVLEGIASGKIASFGRSEAVTLAHGEAEVRILVGEVDAFAALTNLPQAVHGGAAAADGAGRTLLFGGAMAATYGGSAAKTTNTIWAVDLAPPTEDLALFEVGEMPALETGDGRAGHTATLLTGNHDRAGLIFVAGGTSEFLAGEVATDTAFLWDPATSTVAGSIELRNKRFLHLAIEDAAGNVLLHGGLAETDPNYIAIEDSVEVYVPQTDTMSRIGGTFTTGYLWSAGASLGGDGVLLCGGLYADTSGWKGSEGCDRITTSLALVEAEPLSQPLMFAAMTGFAEGKALLTGGLPTGTGYLEGTEAIEATSEAWVYDQGAWRQVEGMQNPRAMHGSALLPDGRVLVFGGSARTVSGYFPDADAAIACAEIFDPQTETFAEVDACDEGDDAASLPFRTAFPIWAADPRYSVMVLGGLSPHNTYSGGAASDGAALFTPCPERGSC